MSVVCATSVSQACWVSEVWSVSVTWAVSVSVSGAVSCVSGADTYAISSVQWTTLEPVDRVDPVEHTGACSLSQLLIMINVPSGTFYQPHQVPREHVLLVPWWSRYWSCSLGINGSCTNMNLNVLLLSTCRYPKSRVFWEPLYVAPDTVNKEQRSRITVSIALGNNGREGGKANQPDEDSPHTPPRYARVDSVSTNVPVLVSAGPTSGLSVGVGTGTFLSMVLRTSDSRLKFNITAVFQLKPCFLMYKTASRRCLILRVHTTNMTMEAYCPPVCK